MHITTHWLTSRTTSSKYSGSGSVGKRKRDMYWLPVNHKPLSTHSVHVESVGIFLVAIQVCAFCVCVHMWVCFLVCQCTLHTLLPGMLFGNKKQCTWMSIWYLLVKHSIKWGYIAIDYLLRDSGRVDPLRMHHYLSKHMCTCVHEVVCAMFMCAMFMCASVCAYSNNKGPWPKYMITITYKLGSLPSWQKTTYWYTCNEIHPKLILEDCYNLHGFSILHWLDMHFYMLCSIKYTWIVGHGRLHSRIQPQSAMIIFGKSFWNSVGSLNSKIKGMRHRIICSYYAGVSPLPINDIQELII